MRPPFGGRFGIIEGKPSARRRGRPGRGRRGSRGRGWFGRHGRRRRARRGLLRTGWRLASGHRRRRSGRQFDEHRIRHETRGGQFALRVGVARIGRGHHTHRNGLRLVARKGKAHREFVGSNRKRAGGPASLPGRGPGFCTGRLGFKLHAGCRRGRFHEARRIELHPIWEAGASSEAQSAGCDCDNSFHDQYRPLVWPNSRVTLTQGETGEVCNRQRPLATRPDAATAGMTAGMTAGNDTPAASVRRVQ